MITSSGLLISAIARVDKRSQCNACIDPGLMANLKAVFVPVVRDINAAARS